MASWFNARNLPADSKDIYVHWGPYVLRVVRQTLPSHMTNGQALDEMQRRFNKRPGIIRVVAGDPGRCELVIRLDDALPMMTAWQEENW